MAELDLREPTLPSLNIKDEVVRRGPQPMVNKIDVGVVLQGAEFSDDPLDASRNDLVAGVDEQYLED